MRLALLGTGFISRFYAETLVAQRRKDIITMVYGRNHDKAKKFAADYSIPNHVTNMKEAVAHDDVDAVIIALPNDLHLEAVMKCVEAGKKVMCTKPLGRNANEALAMMKAVERAGIASGYLEDLCYTPKFLKSMDSIKKGAIGRVIWTKSRETHPGPHSEWFWNKEKAGGGAIIDLGCHCVEISRNYIGKNVRPIEVMCWADTCMHPIDAEDNAVGLVKYANGAIGQFEVSWSFRGGMDLRDEVMGTEGTIWTNNFLRTGFEMFSTGKGNSYIAEKSETSQGWLFPVGDETHELGYNHMFTDMLNAFEKNEQPQESFYDGYIVNAILDAAYRSAETKKWEPVLIEDWRGSDDVDLHRTGNSYDENFFLVKEEILPSGEKKVILKNKKTGKIEEREGERERGVK